MRIEFDPTNPDEATAVRAMLTAMHPEPWALQTEHGSARIESNGKITFSAEAITIPDADEPFMVNGQPLVADSNGEPWDARIHSTPPTTNKDGTWRAKRGVTADQIAAVKAEREALKGVVEEADVTAETVEAMHAVSAAFEEPVTAPPAPPAPMVPPAITEIVEQVMASPSFLDVMKAITAAQKDGKIDTAKVKELCAAVGAGESTMGLNGPDNGDKRGAFMAALEETINA